MKVLNKTLVSAFLFLCLTHCKSKTQGEAEQTAMNIAKTMEETTSESEINSNAFYMKATIDGKKWAATRMTPDNSTKTGYQLIHGETDDITITYNLYKPETGMKTVFGEEEMMTLMTNEGFFSGKKGELIVKEVNDKWIEGTFHFTATSSSSAKVIEVKDASFRLAILND